MRNDAISTLLLEVYPLIGQARGEQRSYLRQAWVAAADVNARAVLKVHPDQMPTTPRDAMRELLGLVMQLAKQTGMSSADLIDHFNERADAGTLIAAIDPDKTITATHALLAVMAARRLEDLHPEPQEAKSA